ncbi:MAG: hypothetical protein WBG90_15180 [Saonia sp.]
MEKLAYGLSFLTVLYIVFLYLTAKTLLKDSLHRDSSNTEEKFKNDKIGRRNSNDYK